MSETKPEYITEAMDLLRGEPAAIIEQPRANIVLRDGLGEEWTVAWVKLSTAFKPHIKELRGAPLAVWLYIALSINKQGVSFPAIRTIAEDTGYSHQGVLDAIKALEEKGYLKVRRGERKFNLYEPEFAAIGRTNEPSGTVNLVDSSAPKSQVYPPDESTFSPDESSPLDLNKKNKRDKRGDEIDGMLYYGKLAQSQGEDKVEEVITALERGLRVNIGRTLANQQVAKRIIKDGRPLETWLSWVRSDEWRLARLYIYADMEKVWRDYPQAFGGDEGMNPQGLEVGV